MTLYSRKEAAAILGVSMTTLDKMREDRKIGYLQARPGGKVQFTQSHIDKYFQRIESNMFLKEKKLLFIVPTVRK